MRAWTWMTIPLLAGCWKADPSGLPDGSRPFDAAGAPDGWLIDTLDVDLGTCPDGETPRLFIVYPDGVSTPLPLAVIFHSGAFDYVSSPHAEDPTYGDHLQSPSRLDRDWAVGQVHATLGTGPQADPFTEPVGSLAVALAEQDTAMLLATNCWGDLWHNESGALRANDLAADGFAREGFSAADFSWKMAFEPGFPTANRITLPVAVDHDRILLIGQGEGGHAVTELLLDGVTPAGVAVDSVADDLTTYYDGDASLYVEHVAALDRIFPTGRDAAAEVTLSNVTLPDRTAYIYSTMDSRLPADAHAKAIVAVRAAAEGMVVDVGESDHVVTASNLRVAREVVAHLLDAAPVTGDTGDTGD